MHRPKSKSVFACFAIENNPAERISALEAIFYKEIATILPYECNETKPYPHGEFIEMMSEHEFVLSPPGNMDADCHRTWEALYLGCIPICKRMGATKFFTDLPILFVDDWREITPGRLFEASMELAPKWKNAHKMLWMPYWEKRIRGIIENSR